MSNLTKTSATRSNGSSASPMTTRGRRLSGLNWLIWRQHRAGFWTLLAITAMGVAWLVYQRTELINQLTAQGWPDSAPGMLLRNQPTQQVQTLVGLSLGFIPIVLGVFLGAPLLAGDLENGTAKLVASQSVTPIRWLATKLGFSALVVIVCTAALSVAFGRWWGPVKSPPTAIRWSDGVVFDNTGPVPVALTLFTVVGGVAIGMLLRRTLISMVITFGFAVVVQLVWSYFRLDLGHVLTLTTHKGISEDATSQIPQDALEVDRWFLSGSGQTHPWGTCVANNLSEKVCIQKFDLVGWRVDYLPMSQMSSMQWFGASILFALTAAVTVFIFIRGRKRIV